MGEIDSALQILRQIRDMREHYTGKQGPAEHTISAEPISPPLSRVSWLSAPGRLAFGLPGGFFLADPRAYGGRLQAAVLLVEDGSGMWLAVFEDQHLTGEVVGSRSPWAVLEFPDLYRKRCKKWGGIVTSGPSPILVAGERAIWTAFSMTENGQHHRTYAAFSKHYGKSYEAVMRVQPHAEEIYRGVFWTAIGSWRWLEYGEALSQDGRLLWDGLRWRSVPDAAIPGMP